MTQDVEKIAAGLSERALAYMKHLGRGFVLLPQGWTRWSLSRSGLIEPFLPEFFKGAGWQLTERGLAVRTFLQEQDNG